MADALTVDEQVFGGKWKALKEQMDNKYTGLSRKMNIYTAKLRSLTDEFANDLETTHQIHSVMVEEFNKLQEPVRQTPFGAVAIKRYNGPVIMEDEQPKPGKGFRWPTTFYHTIKINST